MGLINSISSEEHKEISLQVQKGAHPLQPIMLHLLSTSMKVNPESQ